MRSEAVVRSIHFSQICWGEKQHISIYPGVRNSEHQPAIETTNQHDASATTPERMWLQELKLPQQNAHSGIKSEASQSFPPCKKRVEESNARLNPSKNYPGKRPRHCVVRILEGKVEMT
jgi:hypothetical protein